MELEADIPESYAVECDYTPFTSSQQWPEALEHLDFAIAEFRDMKMQPSLERALRHKEILGA